MADDLNKMGKSEARKNFLSILNDFAAGILRPLLVTDHGEAQAVILPFQEYQLMKIKIDAYEKMTAQKEKKSIWGNDINLHEDFEKSTWSEVYDDWLKKWGDEDCPITL